MINLTFISGPGGCSKSTLGEVTAELAKDPRRVIWIDSSRCIRNSRKFGRETRQELLALEPQEKAGFILPGQIVVKSVLENLQWLKKGLPIMNAIIPGCPRSDEEVDEWNLAVGQGLVSYRTVFVECDEERIKEGVNERIKKRIIRADDGPEELKTRLAEYNQKTLPMIKRLPEVWRTSRSKPFTERLRDVVNAMDVPVEMRETWLRRLNTDTHPIHRTIRSIEGIPEPVYDRAPVWDSRFRPWKPSTRMPMFQGA